MRRKEVVCDYFTTRIVIWTAKLRCYGPYYGPYSEDFLVVRSGLRLWKLERHLEDIYLGRQNPQKPCTGCCYTSVVMQISCAKLLQILQLFRPRYKIGVPSKAGVRFAQPKNLHSAFAGLGWDITAVRNPLAVPIQLFVNCQNGFGHIEPSESLYEDAPEL